MKTIIKTFIMLVPFLLFFGQVNSVYKYIGITDDNEYFIKYSELKDNYVKDIKNGSIKISLKGNKKDTKFFCGKKGCYFLNTNKNGFVDNGIISINRKGKIINMPYEINFHKKSFNLDVFNKKNECRYILKDGIDITDKMSQKNIQKKALSCEISATADILSHLMGGKVKEDILLKKLPKSKYNNLPIEKDGKKYWGNPNSGFVGYIDKLPNGKTARQRKMTGYGVLERPIEKIINNYGFKTKIITQDDYKPNFDKEEHLSLILRELEEGNMVQLWGDICTNPKYFNGKEHGCYHKGKPSWNSERIISWFYKNSDGKEKKYIGLNGEHAFYLLGYKGDIDNPTHVIVWDTYTGRHIYVTSEWMRKWKKMQYKSIIIFAK